jgi:hypothetical protein
MHAFGAGQPREYLNLAWSYTAANVISGNVTGSTEQHVQRS